MMISTVRGAPCGMKSRVQRGRAQLRQMLDECCEIALDARGKLTAFAPRPGPCAYKAALADWMRCGDRRR